MINFTASSVSDMLWVLPLVLVAFTIDKKPILSGVLYGIACAMKQPPWLLAPFIIIYLVRSQHTEETRIKLLRIAKFVGPALALFFLVNLPFAFGDALGWFRNVVTPVTTDLVILSQGPAVLSQVGLIDVGRAFYTILTIGVLVVLVTNYYIYFKQLRYVVWILPGVILWFSYRTLTSYVIYWIPLMLVSLILWYNSASNHGSGRRPT